MAVSRVGGSNGLLKGQIGDVIYQVKKNPDGTYTQYVYSKGGYTESMFTPKLQAQRMCVAMVENLMKQLKPIGNISFQSGANKSKSLNAFSSANLRLVQRDCQDHWYGDNRWVFPRRYSTIKDIQDLGGAYMISSGSLNYNLFDRLVYDDFPAVKYADVPTAGLQFYGVEFKCDLGVMTVDQFRQSHKMTIMDTVAFAGFREWIDSVSSPDDPITYDKHSYFILTFNILVSSQSVMTPDVIRSLFKVDSDMEISFLFARDGKSFAIGRLAQLDAMDESFWYTAAFSISKITGKKQVSDSFYRNPDGGNDPWWIGQCPAKVFGSWMGEPWNDNYPSPF